MQGLQFCGQHCFSPPYTADVLLNIPPPYHVLACEQAAKWGVGRRPRRRSERGCSALPAR